MAKRPLSITGFAQPEKDGTWSAAVLLEGLSKDQAVALSDLMYGPAKAAALAYLSDGGKKGIRTEPVILENKAVAPGSETKQ